MFPQKQKYSQSVQTSLIKTSSGPKYKLNEGNKQTKQILRQQNQPLLETLTKRDDHLTDLQVCLKIDLRWYIIIPYNVHGNYLKILAPTDGLEEPANKYGHEPKKRKTFHLNLQYPILHYKIHNYQVHPKAPVWYTWSSMMRTKE